MHVSADIRWRIRKGSCSQLTRIGYAHHLLCVCAFAFVSHVFLTISFFILFFFLLLLFVEVFRRFLLYEQHLRTLPPSGLLIYKRGAVPKATKITQQQQQQTKQEQHRQ